MGVYIPNMKMPEHCGVCRFAVDGWCYAYGKPNIDALANDGRTNFCPLVPVPPHGRLIDADAVFKRLQKQAMSVWGNSNPRYQIILEVMDAIRFAPAIIPAEKGE